jgi:hypothetical protein
MNKDIPGFFVFRKSFYEAIRILPRAIQGELLTAIVEIGLYGERTELPKPIGRSIITLVKPRIAEDKRRYTKVSGCRDIEEDFFIFRTTFYEAIRYLPREIQGELLTSIVENGLYGERTESLKPIGRSVIALIARILAEDKKMYAKQSEEPRTAACDSVAGEQCDNHVAGDVTTPPAAVKKQRETIENQKNKEKEKRTKKEKEAVNNIIDKNIFIAESIKEKEINKEKEKEKKFVKPTVEEVAAEIQRRGYKEVDAESFVCFYESKGWKVGLTPMKSWKAALTTWGKRRERSDNHETNYYRLQQPRGVETKAKTGDDYSGAF